MSVRLARVVVPIGLVAVLVTGCIPEGSVHRGGTPAPVALVSASPEPAATATPTPASSSISASPSPSPDPSSSPDPSAEPTVSPTPSPTPLPVRKPVTVNLVRHPASAFITEIRKTWCSPSGTQMVLAFNGKVDLTAATQAAIVRKSKAYWSYADSHTPGWGPGMMAKVLAAYGVPGYQVRTYRSRAAALLDAAQAVERYRQPVLLLVWWGAHTWVMTGFKATADPLVFKDATVTGTYILDPWYPRISSIWGPSDPPGTFQDAAEMVRNYIRWTRPEGRYPGRDGMFVAVVPTRPAPKP